MSPARFMARRRHAALSGGGSHSTFCFSHKKQGAAGITTAAPYVAG
jgi:hypothetical protein